MRHSLTCSLTAFALAWAGSALADPPKLKGDYAFTGTAACLFAPGSSGTQFNPTPGVPLPNSGFDASLHPIDGHVYSSSNATEGIRTFNGDGTGTVTGTDVSITVPPTPGPLATAGYPSFGPGASSDTFSFQFTYTINNDGTYTSKLVPGSFQGSILTGGRVGQTFTVNLPDAVGLIGADAKTLTSASVQPTVETISFSNGDVWPRICYRSRILVKIGNER
jgi:hypothetical protein